MWLERTLSRVLFPIAVTRYGATIIPLGPPLPTASSSLTRELRTGRPQTLPYLALLRMGFTELPTSPTALVSSYLTLSPLSIFAVDGLLSVALSLGSPPVPVKDHPALWSPDFPPVQVHGPAIAWLSPTTSDYQSRRSVRCFHKKQTAALWTGLNLFDDKEAVEHLRWQMHMTTEASSTASFNDG